MNTSWLREKFKIQNKVTFFIKGGAAAVLFRGLKGAFNVLRISFVEGRFLYSLLSLGGFIIIIGGYYFFAKGIDEFVNLAGERSDWENVLVVLKLQVIVFVTGFVAFIFFMMSSFLRVTG